MFHTEDTHVLGVTLQKFFARSTWRPEFVHPWVSLSVIHIHSLSDLVGKNILEHQ